MKNSIEVNTKDSIDINEYIPPKLEQFIKSGIINQCRLYRNNDKLSKHEYEPYTRLRKKHQITGFIYSAFPPAELKKDGVVIRETACGNYSMPQIVTEKSVIEIFRDSNKLNTKHIKKRCKQYNKSTDSDQRYFIVTFDCSNDGNLKSIKLKYLNSKNKLEQIETIYDSSSFENSQAV